MSTEGLINVCQAVKHGDCRQVKNRKTGEEGVVLDVRGDRLVVQLEQASDSWPYEDCECIKS